MVDLMHSNPTMKLQINRNFAGISCISVKYPTLHDFPLSQQIAAQWHRCLKSHGHQCSYWTGSVNWNFQETSFYANCVPVGWEIVLKVLENWESTKKTQVISLSQNSNGSWKQSSLRSAFLLKKSHKLPSLPQDIRDRSRGRSCIIRNCRWSCRTSM